jgi:hypothetical protein
MEPPANVPEPFVNVLLVAMVRPDVCVSVPSVKKTLLLTVTALFHV